MVVALVGAPYPLVVVVVASVGGLYGPAVVVVVAMHGDPDPPEPPQELTFVATHAPHEVSVGCVQI